MFPFLFLFCIFSLTHAVLIGERKPISIQSYEAKLALNCTLSAIESEYDISIKDLRLVVKIEKQVVNGVLYYLTLYYEIKNKGLCVEGRTIMKNKNWYFLDAQRYIVSSQTACPNPL